MKPRGFLDAFWLKLILAALMLLDHLYYGLVPSLGWAHLASRVVAPAFCFLMTEGMRHTGNRPRYIARMLGTGAVMLAGNYLLYFLYGRWIQNSILMALGLGAALIACLDNAREAPPGRKPLWLLGAALALLSSWAFEGKLLIPLTAVIFYYLGSRPPLMWGVYFLAICAPHLTTWDRTGHLPANFWMMLAVIPVMCYSGRRGPGGAFGKYFFYVFYPLHIWVIFLVEQRLG